MRLIDADALKNMRFSCGMIDENQVIYAPIREVFKNIDKAPTIGGWISVKDGLPEEEIKETKQKHGHWKTVSDYYDDEHWQCSACGCEWYLEAGSPTENNMHYCPECGAKMDEEVKQDDHA